MRTQFLLNADGQWVGWEDNRGAKASFERDATGKLTAEKTPNGTRLFDEADVEQLARARERSRGVKTRG